MLFLKKYEYKLFRIWANFECDYEYVKTLNRDLKILN